MFYSDLKVWDGKVDDDFWECLFEVALEDRIDEEMTENYIFLEDDYSEREKRIRKGYLKSFYSTPEPKFREVDDTVYTDNETVYFPSTKEIQTNKEEIELAEKDNFIKRRKFTLEFLQKESKKPVENKMKFSNAIKEKYSDYFKDEVKYEDPFAYIPIKERNFTPNNRSGVEDPYMDDSDEKDLFSDFANIENPLANNTTDPYTDDSDEKDFFSDVYNKVKDSFPNIRDDEAPF